MINAILISIAVAQAPLGPIVPAGASRAFHEAVVAVEEKLEAGNFAEAGTAAKVLPKSTVKVQWDDSKVPQEKRELFATLRDKAFAMWTQMLPGFKIELAPKGDVKISFTDRLAEDPASGLPAGAAHLISPSPDETRLETIIALSRNVKPEPTSAEDVHNEVAYSIAAYLGMERAVKVGGFASRVDMAGTGMSRLYANELWLAKRLLEVSDELRAAVQKKTKMTVARPQLLVNPGKLELDPVVQLDEVKFSIQVTNTGNAPLTVQVMPDCNCLSANYPNLIEPGQSALIQAQVDTIQFVGDLKKKFFIYSNDMDFPYREVPVNVMVEPLYRFIVEKPVTIYGEDGADLNAYLFLHPKANIKPTSARIDGIRGTITYEPWQGKMADPMLNEPEKQRSGYKFKVHLEQTSVPGRVPLSLVVNTDNEMFPRLMTQAHVQKGIVALPMRVYFGEIPRGPRRSSFLLSRPETGFKILKVESSNTNITVTHEPVRGQWEHKVTVELSGKAEAGILDSTITIHTDDPKQPQILVPVVGTIR